jgi:hypothetical protein
MAMESFRMSDAPKTPDAVRLLAEQQGLAKALRLFPEGVQAAAERGAKPLGELPAGTTSISSPAHIFNPARFEKSE